MFGSRLAASILALMAMGVAISAHAVDEGRATAQGAGYALVVSEKCSGHPRAMEEVTAAQRGLFTSLQRSGYEFEQIKAGYLDGVLIAERRFPGASKPPKRECQEAQNIKRAIDKLQ